MMIISFEFLLILLTPAAAKVRSINPLSSSVRSQRLSATPLERVSNSETFEPIERLELIFLRL